MPNPATSPGYSISDVVYLRASAALGYLESYRVDGIVYDEITSAWKYRIDITAAQGAGFTVGHTNDLRAERILYFTESELMTGCDAMTLVETNFTSRLARIQAQMVESGCDQTG